MAAKGEATGDWAKVAGTGFPVAGAGVSSGAAKGLEDMPLRGNRFPASAKGLDWGGATGPEATAKGEPAKLGAAPGTVEKGLADPAGGAALKFAMATWARLDVSKMATIRAKGSVTSISSSARNGRWKRRGHAA